MSGDPFTDLLAIEAEQRQELHANHASNRPLSEGYELVGLVGEAEFARVFNLPMDLNRRPGGDRGIDFVVPLGFTTDVKTFRKPIHLLVEYGKVVADIYVLAGYSDELRKAHLLGWEYGANVLKAPHKPWVCDGGTIDSHYIHRDVLKKMPELERRLMGLAWQGRS